MPWQPPVATSFGSLEATWEDAEAGLHRQALSDFSGGIISLAERCRQAGAGTVGTVGSAVGMRI